jgi:HK97 family phage major capsid protein
MRDLQLARDVDVLSGAAAERSERDLQDEKFRIISRRNSEHQARRLKRQMLGQMASEPAARAGMLPSVMALSNYERRNYSIARLVSSITKSKKENCLETELSESISADLGNVVPPHGGCWVPFAIRAAGLDTKTNSGGRYTVATDVGGDIVDALRASTMVLKLGAQLVNVRANLSLPIEDVIMSATWVAENPGTDVSQSDSSFQQRFMTPHNVEATTSASRQLIAQATPDVSRWLTGRIARAHGLLLDKACIHGTGTSNQPLGLLATSGVGVVPIGTNGGPCTAANLISMEGLVGAANGDTGDLAYLTNSAQRQRLRGVPEMASSTIPVWRDSQLLGYPAQTSNQLSSTLVKGSSGAVCSAIIFGNWNALVVAIFDGVIEVLTDEFTSKKQNLIEISSYAGYDLALTTPASFSAIVDAI